MTVMTEGRHAAEFVLSEAARSRSREQVTIESGAGVLAAGTVIGAKSNNKHVASPVAVTDGAETPTAITLYEVDATSADVEVAVIARDAEVNGKILSYAADVDLPAEVAAKEAALAAVGIIVR